MSSRVSPRFGLSQRLSRELRMSKTRIPTMVLLGVMRKIGKSTGSNPAFFVSRCKQGAGATARSAMLVLIVALLVSPLPVSAATPDPVLEWIDVMNTSVFDAVNGIDPRFRPLLVKPSAPHNASQRAAAIQAAYVILLNLYPAQSGTLNTRRNASLMALASTEKAESIAAGVAWGQTVADAIWTLRLTDGFAPPPPPFLGAPNVGVWRPTPQGLPDQLPGNPGATPQIATMTPWVLTRPSQFRLPPPLDRNSPEYVADLNEVKSMGVYSGSGRSDDQSELALFWALNTPLAWNRIAAQLSAKREFRLIIG